MKNILFIVDAGDNIGLGHYKRCLELANRWHHGANSIFLTQSKEVLSLNKNIPTYVTYHPNSLIKDATNTCNTVLAVVENSAIAGLIKEKPFYRSISIPGGMYRGNPKDIKTFGLGATVVTSIRTSPNIVYEVVKSVFEDFDKFKNMHPAFAVLRKKEMIEESLSAPLHIGALKYYKERGWI